jgi:hypothetical protein
MESNPQEPQTVNAIVPRTNPEIKDGVIVIKTLDEACRHAAMIHKSGLAPDHFNSPEKVLVAMQMAQELGLPPMTALKSMYVVNGTPSLFGDLPLAVVQKSGLMESISELWFDVNDVLIHKDNKNADAEVHRAECTVKRFGMEPVTRSFSLKEARTAGLDKNVYLKYRKRMLQMRARSWALKDAFPDILNGISIKEYDSYDQAKDVSPTVTRPLSLNEKLLLQQEQAKANPPVEAPKSVTIEDIKNEIHEGTEMILDSMAKDMKAEQFAEKQELPPKEKSTMQMMAGQMRITCIPELKDMKIKEVPEADLLDLLQKSDESNDHLSEDFKVFYANACVWLGRKKSAKHG